MRHTRTLLLPLAAVTLSLFSTSTTAQTWTQVADYAGTSRWSSLGFAIDGVGYVGTGGDINGSTLSDMWKYDAGTNTWSPSAAMGGNSRNYAWGFAVDGKGYAGHGNNVSSDWWSYEPTLDAWTQLANFSAIGNCSSSTGFVIGSTIYITTGLCSSCLYCTDLWAYDHFTDTWTQKASLPASGRFGSVAFAINGKGYLATGQSILGTQQTDLWEYDPIANAWAQKASLPAGEGRYEAMGFAVGSHGYIVGGLDEANNPTSDAWQYSPAIDSWSPIEDFPGVGTFGGTAFVINNAAYLVNGGGQAGSIDCWTIQDDISTSVREQEVSLATIYPNPASTVLTIHAPKQPSRIACHDALGRLVPVQLSGNGSIPLEGFEPGTYRLDLYWPNGSHQGSTFVKL